MPDTGARLTILNGPLAGKELALGEAVDNVLIGSDGSCRFHIPSPGISPIHARIWKDAGGVTVYDTHSPRGLYINDNRVDGQAPLKNGDVLWLGTPGEEEAVMIQVRLPPRRAEAADGPATRGTAEEPEIADETLTMDSPTVAPPAESDEFAVAVPEDSDADATMLEMAAEEVGEAVAEKDADATVAEFTPRVSAPIPAPEPDEFAIAEPEDTEATRLEPGGRSAVAPDEHATIAMMPGAVEEPVRFAVDLAPPMPAEPPRFEDETAEEAAPPAATSAPWQAPPPPRPPPPPAPRPAAAAPPRPAPAPRPAVRAAAPPPRPSPARAASADMRTALIAGVGALLLAGGGFAAWRLLRGSAQVGEAATPAVAEPEPPATAAPAGPAPTQARARVPEPVLEPPVEEAVTIVTDTPPTTLAAGISPRPTPTARAATPPPTTISPEVARAQQAAQQVASLLSHADAAVAARDYAGATVAYEEVLKLEPGNARAAEGRAQAQATLAALKKAFVAGRTTVTVTGGKAAKGGLSGFDSEDVSVAKALDYSGRIDFEASPRNVKPGDSYNVQVYLTNDGKKGFKIGNVSVTTAVNGARSGGPAAVRVKDVEPGQRVLLAEMPGTWQASTTSWSLEVVVTSSRNDTFRSQLSWR